MQVAKEHFIQEVIGNVQTTDPGCGTGANIEQEFVTIAQFDEEA